MTAEALVQGKAVQAKLKHHQQGQEGKAQAARDSGDFLMAGP